MRTEPGESALPAEARRGRSPAFRDNTRVSLVIPLVARAFARGAGRARNERQTEFPLADRRLLRESGATTRPSRAALLEGCFPYVTSRHARRASDTRTDTPSEGELLPPTFRRICCREARSHETTHGQSAPTASSFNEWNDKSRHTMPRLAIRAPAPCV